MTVPSQMSETAAFDAKESALEQILASYLEAKERGDAVDRDRVRAENPQLADELLAFFENEDRLARAAGSMRQRRQHRAAWLDANAPTLQIAEGASFEPQVGATVRYFGDYEIVEEIARGGMGVVFKARQVSLNRIVALKMILSGQFASADDIARFGREAEAAGQLDHPNIVPIHETGVYAGQQYYSMKFIEGKSLTHWLAAFRQSLSTVAVDGARPTKAMWRARIRDAIALLATTARAVHHAHQRGIIHRDLKPANILVDADGQPHVTDFGLARLMHRDESVTRTGSVVGTPSYMAPEQASGKRGAVSTLADVYSLGAILYQVLTGRPPFQTDSIADLLVAVLSAEPESPSYIDSNIDRGLEAACLKCLSKRPEDRYASAAALADDLEAWLRGEPLQAQSPGIARLAWAWLRKNVRAAVWLVLIGILTGGMCGACVTLFAGNTVMSQVGKTYEKFYPSLDPPWIAISYEVPWFVYPFSLLLAGIMFGSMGALTHWALRPKDTVSDLSAGLAVGLIAGVALYVAGIGWATSISGTIVHSLADYQLFAKATQWTPGKAGVGKEPEHPTAVLVEQYPDLKKVPPNERGDAFFPKIVSDQVAGALWGVWVGMVFSLSVGIGVASMQSTIAGQLARSGRTRIACVVSYVEWSILSMLLAVGFATTLMTFGGLTWQFVVQCLAQSAVLGSCVAVALGGLLLGWPWGLRLTLYALIARFMPRTVERPLGEWLSGQVLPISVPDVLLLVCGAVVVVFYMTRQGARAATTQLPAEHVAHVGEARPSQLP